jgi:hypothetical protein
MEDKRRFTRIIFSTVASLKIGDKAYETSLVDLSLKGALIKSENDLSEYTDKDCTLSFTLPDTEISIELFGFIAHVEKQNIGIACTKMDLESVSHLKRLITLNLGDEDFLNRELASLSYP